MLAARIRDKFWLAHWTDSLCWDCTEKNRSTKEVFPHLDQRLWQHFGLKQLKHTIHDVFPAFPENISMAMSQCKQSSCRLLRLQIFTKCNWKTFTSLKYDENFNKHAEKNVFNYVKQVYHSQMWNVYFFHNRKLSGLKRGEKVLTSGGIRNVVNLHSEITRLSNTSDRL